MRQVVLELGLFDPAVAGSNVKWSEMTLRPLLEITAWANTVHLHFRPTLPSLYELGAAGVVRYKTENDNPGVEPFYSLIEVLKRNGSDCNNLCPWIVAELRFRGTRPLWNQNNARAAADWKERQVRYAKGEPAAFRLVKFDKPGKPLLYHVQVWRAPTSVIPNPKDPMLIEDPSAILGMPT